MIRKAKKHSYSSQWEKKNWEKLDFCFITGCFIKPFQITIKINHFFYFTNSFTAQFSLFDIRGIKRGDWEQQIARDGELNIYFKNNFNLLVMNVTQLNFLNWQNVHIWHFIKVNYKKSLLFVVVPTLISWRKTKIFTDYNDKT